MKKVIVIPAYNEATAIDEVVRGASGIADDQANDAAREGLSEEMARDPRVFVVGEGIGARGGNFNTTTGLFERHGAERLPPRAVGERRG